MKNLEDLEILAALENLRIGIGQKEDADFALRAASAIIAKAIGYTSRHEWASYLRELDMIGSDRSSEGKDRAESLYNYTMGKLDRNTKASAE